MRNPDHGSPYQFAVSTRLRPWSRSIAEKQNSPDGGKTEHFISAVNGTASFTFIPAENEPAGPWKLEAEELASGTKAVQTWTR